MLDFMYVKLKKAVPNVWLKNIPDIATVTCGTFILLIQELSCVHA